MAGIGFALKKLGDTQTLSASVAAFGVSAIISSGPWLFTVVAVASLYYASAAIVGLDTLYDFRTALIYNFAITLVASAPVAMVTTRLLADRIYAKDAKEAPGVLLAALALTLLSQAPIALALYLWIAEFDPALRAAAIVNYFLVAALWVAAVFLSALKDYWTVTIAFAVGLFVAFLAGYALSPFGAAGLMTGFSIGLTVALFVIIARTFAEYPHGVAGWTLLLTYFQRFPDVALSGLVYNAAIWIDKWVMWTAPEAVWPASNLVTYPMYDGAMFFAQLTLVPALALFVLSVETSFFDAYRRFYRAIDAHGSWGRIEAAHQGIKDAMAAAARRLIVLQVCVALFALLLSPGIAMALGIHGQQIGIFRFGVMGSVFHALFLFASIALAYFDLRRQVLIAQCVFFLLNASLTYGSMQLGFAWYGYGYFAASALSFAFAATVLMYEVNRLPYATFVANNPALKPMVRPRVPLRPL
jgi:polysaccharide biosynthesis protein PelG